MKVSIIKVNMFEGRSKDALKPLIFPILAGLTPKEIEMNYLDDRVEVLPDTLDSDVIALSFDTFAAKRAYSLAKKYKTTSNLIVLGGFHPSIMQEEAKAYADVLLLGDAEDTWPKFIEDALHGSVKSEYISSGVAEFGCIDTNHEAFRGKHYQKLGIVQFSRGCKYGCDFCSIKAMYPGRVRQKSIDIIVKEIKAMKEKLLFFVDDNLFLDETSAKELFQAIKPLKKKWACQISMEVAAKDELLRMMRESGCVLVLMGFESLNKDNLKRMNKSANLAIYTYEQAISNIYKHGLLIYATFVLGYDEDTPDSIEATMRFALKHNFAVANFNPLIPLPGTPLYDRLKKEGRLLYDPWWLEASYCYGDTAFLPKGMSPEALKEGCKSARFRYYGMKSILKRLFSNRLHLKPGNFFLYLAVNIISNIEIHRKQGKLLGVAKDEISLDKT
jgi:radical SAM superfamily enzyme YgiQ (UPF0313 family)